ncbi:hypothetical protein B0H12DRAFT_1099135 [Mycena haematopus]|nr:hypothetical protein B0H12DRAFT_1099135 [Mycena haematopus]
MPMSVFSMTIAYSGHHILYVQAEVNQHRVLQKATEILRDRFGQRRKILYDKLQRGRSGEEKYPLFASSNRCH